MAYVRPGGVVLSVRDRRAALASRDGSTGYADGPNGEPTAATLVNTLGEWELVNVIMRYGEEHWARRIARAILRARRRPRCRPLKIWRLSLPR